MSSEEPPAITLVITLSNSEHIHLAKQKLIECAQEKLLFFSCLSCEGGAQWAPFETVIFFLKLTSLSWSFHGQPFSGLEKGWP